MSTAIAGGRSIAAARVRRERRTVRPEWWLYAIALLAWSALLAHAVLAGARGDAMHHNLRPTEDSVGHSLLMVAAMMLPLLVPHARAVVHRGLWAHRCRAIAAFGLGYLVAWLGFSVALELAFAAAATTNGAGLTVLLLLVAAGWQCTPARRALWRRCCRLPPMAVAGSRATGDRFLAGQRIGWLCVGTCGPIMAAMSVGHGLGIAVGVSGVLFAEHRRGPNPAQRIGAPSQAAWLVILAGLVGLAAAIPALGPLA